ncbi:hypothetical protein [Pseudomonas mangiferae]|uniref:hypothetical protein n=1 Tax=Pseudomonas mangiferae TaxID=2593654 RepID=UPI001E3E8887|nr:hypothetical protein [Pseudomonas mangiferae]
MRIDPSALMPAPQENGRAQQTDEPETDRGVLQEQIRAAQSGIRVSLSALGKAKASQSQKNEDIDKSELPDTVKGQLKTIRRIRAEIAETQEELRALAADPRLDPQARAERMAAKQSELNALSSALATANGGLMKAMKELKLDSGQMQTAMALSMK